MEKSRIFPIRISWKGLNFPKTNNPHSGSKQEEEKDEKRDDDEQGEEEEQEACGTRNGTI